ncbi:hydroxylase [Sphaerisporangium melleum]|uniref:Hydroxylase n=1 Tax=Sphaerisporangium melleum TaxID=321316 RepID=A0A917R1M7_9ACTN|nr:VOC family protein [Sphaerisporangium melleum]GGK84768.1 hydroxylase [Sphaerisporangium melleum]GII70448.1 hydroxylase [Sphaerisporangium melleum]
MPTRTGYRPGVPCWVDLASPDLPVSAAFYEALFGWRAVFDSGAETGLYGRFVQDGKLVAGIGPTFAPGRPSAWNTYFATADAVSVAEKVQEAGGRVQVGPAQVSDEGTMAVLEDPQGASFLVWEPVRHQGAQLMDEPVALCRSELACRDPEEARTFYREVFGWSARGASRGRGGARDEWLVDGRPIAGLLPLGESYSGAEAPHWLPVFAVTDCDAGADQAARCGGAVLRAPHELPAGRYAVLADACGAAFAVLTPDPGR